MQKKPINFNQKKWTVLLERKFKILSLKKKKVVLKA